MVPLTLTDYPQGSNIRKGVRLPHLMAMHFTCPLDAAYVMEEVWGRVSVSGCVP